MPSRTLVYTVGLRVALATDELMNAANEGRVWSNPEAIVAPEVVANPDELRQRVSETFTVFCDELSVLAKHALDLEQPEIATELLTTHKVLKSRLEYRPLRP